MTHPGTYVNAPTLGVPGLVTGDANTAVSFDPASNQYVVQDDTITPGSITACSIGAVFQSASPANINNNPNFWGFSEGGALAQLVFVIDGSGFVDLVTIGDSASAANAITTTVIADATTYDVVATWDGATVSLYLDGVLENTVAFAGPFDVAGAEKFYAGVDQFNTTGNFSFDGTLDELFCSFTHCATPIEVTAIHAARTGSGSIVTAINATAPDIYWRLGESSGTVAEDSAGSGGNLYTPPIVYDMGPVLPDTTGLQRLLFRHYSPHGRFVTVWKLATDPITYSITQPYPLITPEDVQQGNMPIGQTYTEATYLHVYYGPELVDDEEAERLEASGIGTVT